MIILSPRLKTAADMADGANRIIDVGCDHGYLSAYMLAQKGASFAYACDINQGPLDNAFKTAHAFALADRMDFRLCDGLVSFSGNECDTVFICGMGGELIADILAKAPWTCDGKHTLILQPMTRSEKLRCFLAERGYHIAEERAVYDEKRLYCIIKANGGTGDCGKDNAFLFSDSLKKDVLFNDYIGMLLLKYRAVYQGKKSAGKDVSAETAVIKLLEESYAHR